MDKQRLLDVAAEMVNAENAVKRVCDTAVPEKTFTDAVTRYKKASWIYEITFTPQVVLSFLESLK